MKLRILINLCILVLIANNKMKLHFKIISCSSEEISSPASNLIAGSGLWESARFCQYPQQITLQFYQPITVSSIHIGSHHSKISSKVNILFCLTDKTKNNNSFIFEKYGYLQFTTNENSDYRLRQLKKIQQINKNAEYMRLILWKNYQNSHNFFNQVGLSHITIFGTPYHTNSLPPVINNKSSLMNITMNDYVESKLQVLEQFKHQYVKQDQFESAKQVKQIIKAIKQQGQKLIKLEGDKKLAVNNQEYEKAKQIRSQMQQLKGIIQHISNNFYDPNKKLIKPVLKENKLKSRIQEMLSNNSNASESKVSVIKKEKNEMMIDDSNQVKSEEQNELQENEVNQQLYKSRVSYDNRIIPAILNKKKRQSLAAENISEDQGFEDNQFLEKPKNQQVVEQMTPSAEANASILNEFYEKQVIKKLHSKHWNFKLEALNTIVESSSKWLNQAKQLEKNRIKSILFTFNKIVKEGNFQLSNLNLDLLNELVSTKKQMPKSLTTELMGELQKSVNQIFLKIGENQKIKEKCHEIVSKMLANQLYGPNFVYQTINKSYFNQGLTHNIKIKKQKLTIIENIVQKNGIGTKNGLTFQSIDFMCKVAEDTNEDIRKQATSILKLMKDKGGGNKVIQAIRSRQTLKGSIYKELQA